MDRNRWTCNAVALVIACFVATPLAFAHTDGGIDGTPKTYCEQPGEWSAHDYGPPATGLTLLLFVDGNLQDCDGSGLGALPEVSTSWCPDDIARLDGVVYVCWEPGVVADYDGHAEFALGGAWALACESRCAPSGLGGGAPTCFGEAAHHAHYGLVTVTDAVLREGATFTVAADHVDTGAVAAGQPQDPCGDLESDISEDCVGSCTVSFDPGLDGSYQVYVQGTLGHVDWTLGGRSGNSQHWKPDVLRLKVQGDHQVE